MELINFMKIKLLVLERNKSNFVAKLFPFEWVSRTSGEDFSGAMRAFETGEKKKKIFKNIFRKYFV